VTRELECELCGSTFGCGVDDGECWCFDAPHLPDRGAIAAAGASDCVCPACLRSFAAAGPEVPA
jgi:hypothetical protein